MKNQIKSKVILFLALIINVATSAQDVLRYDIFSGLRVYTDPTPPSTNSSSNNTTTWDASNYSYNPLEYHPLMTHRQYREKQRYELKEREAIDVDTTAYNAYINKDYQKAFELYHKNFKTLYPDGYRTMGYLYEMGWGTLINYFEAVKCYKLAAEQGDDWGELHYGVMLRDGLGIEKNPVEAIHWFSLSALQGNTYGRDCLEWMIYNNKEIPAAAISMGYIKPYDISGLQLLTWIFTWNRGIYSIDTAIAGYKHRAAIGDTIAQVVTGEIYENSNTGSLGRDSAKYWYEKASAQRCTWAAAGLQNVNRTESVYLTSYISYSGIKYYGLFKNGLLEGSGTMSTPSQTWSGTWKEGNLTHGTYKSSEGTYVGDWNDGRINGHGTWKYSDSTKYEGELKNGQWFGEGVYTYNGGFKQYATYVNNKPMNCKYKDVFPNGKIAEEGAYVDSLKEGKVTQYYEDGKVQQVMNYTKGVLNGNVKGYYMNGVLRVDCEYSNGRLWNIAIYHKPDGTPTGCSFKDGAGEVKWYYDDGNLHIDNNYKNGVQDGDYKNYYKNGKLWSEYIYQAGKLWNTLTDNMPDGSPTGTNVKDGNGITMNQSTDGATIIGKTTWQNGYVVKQEIFPAK